MLGTILGFCLATASAASVIEPNRWPGGDRTLERAAESTAAVAVARVAGPIEIVERSAAHLSTQTSRADGTVLSGGGMVFYAHGRQKFDFGEFLHGRGKAGERALEYGYVERTQGFPLPSPKTPIPNGLKLLLLLDDKGEFVKALPDSPESRKAVAAALKKKEEKK
jgi:hypothetical protein